MVSTKSAVWDVAWAAGFFEGEGPFTLTRDRPSSTPRPRISIGQVQRWPLDRFQEAVGRRGRVYILPAHRTSQPIHQLRYDSRSDAQAVAALLEPYLSPKRLAQLAAWRLASMPRYMKTPGFVQQRLIDIETR